MMLGGHLWIFYRIFTFEAVAYVRLFYLLKCVTHYYRMNNYVLHTMYNEQLPFLCPQIVVGSFNTEGKKGPKLHAPSDPMSGPLKMVPMSGTGPSSLPSRGTLSESSGGPGSPLNQGVTASNHGQPGLPSLSWK